jgi:hypothetical protein
MFSRRNRLCLLTCILVGFNANAIAATAIIGPPIQVGQTGVAVPDPYVPVPPTQPCVVNLYAAGSTTGTFDDYANHAFAYTPPASCPGPWNKVVFKADFNVTTGTQFDRTAALWIGGVNLYFGTTQEPRSTVSPSWHVERDVTDLSAALAAAHPGSVAVYNIYNDTYNGSITGAAELDFYPATSAYPAAKTPDLVLPMIADAAGTYAYINTNGDPLARSFSLPGNVERAYLEVTAEPQSGDEFWYACGPDAYIDYTGCGGTGFRETEIAIDGRHAGIAPVSGWVYTGGIDPYLWRPIPGVQTLNFLPYRVDLTPFVALLDNGKAHAVAVRVVNGDPHFQNNSQYFATAANLLLYLDPGSTHITGQVQQPNDSGVHPSVQSSASGDGSQVKFNVLSRHTLTTNGTANTSHGVVTTNVQQALSFDNDQTVIATDTVYDQSITQTSIASSTSSSSGGSTAPTVDVRNWSFPLHMDIDYVVAEDGSATQATTANQGFNLATSHNGPDGTFTSTRSQRAAPADTLNFDAGGNFTGPTGQKSTESYYYRDSSGACYSRAVSAAAGAVTAVSNGVGCSGQ